ncbi:MAG: BrnT family toxin [Burkholderiaceae bacterium]|jgi:uncharacterized DUF497 family protein|nr:BrnT family toxin [Burkholderiaceae bacterium]
MLYEWDEAKRVVNLQKHGLDFLDVDLVLESPYVRIVDSPRGSQMRQQAFAYVFERLHVLTVVFVPGDNHCRVISFRPAKRKEKDSYYEWLEKNDRDDQ